MEEEAVAGEDAAELVALYEKIQGRIDKKTFPLILPEEIPAEDGARERAEEELRLVRACEHAQVRSYLEAV